jgi:hypothetical protein
VGLRAVLDAVVKREILSPCWESNPRIPIIHQEETQREKESTANTGNVIVIKMF